VLTLDEKLHLLGEMQELLSQRANIASQASIPDAVRQGVLRDIDARLAAIETQLS
jgi:hypothetical protein